MNFLFASHLYPDSTLMWTVKRGTWMTFGVYFFLMFPLVSLVSLVGGAVAGVPEVKAIDINAQIKCRSIDCWFYT